MQWTIEYRRCNYCGKEDNCRHDVFGPRFSGWGQMHMHGTCRCSNKVPTQIDICPDCMKTRVMPDIKSDFDLTHGKKTIVTAEVAAEVAKIVTINGVLRDWIIVFDSQMAGPDLYWDDCEKKITADINHASRFSAPDVDQVLNRLRIIGVEAIGLSSPHAQRLSNLCEDKKCACDGVTSSPLILPEE